MPLRLPARWRTASPSSSRLPVSAVRTLSLLARAPPPSRPCCPPPPLLVPPRAPLCARRFHASAPAHADENVISTERYHALANQTMDGLCDALEAMAEVREDVDVEFSAGVLTASFSQGTYVVNKQPPNRQIWLSSPISGPKRYDWDTERGTWVYSRDGSTLLGLLKDEMGVELELEVNA